MKRISPAIRYLFIAALTLVFLPTGAQAADSIAITITDVLGRSTLLVMGDTLEQALEVEIENVAAATDPSPNISVDNISVKLNAGTFFTASDASSLLLFSSAGVLLDSIAVTTTNPLVLDPGANVLGPGATVRYYVGVIAAAASDGGRFSIEVNSASPAAGSNGVTTTRGAVTNNSPVHSGTSRNITIPVISVTAGNMDQYNPVVSPNSDVQSFMGLRVGAIDDADVSHRLASVQMILHNVRNFTPGGTSADDLGDLQYYYIFKDGGNGKFTPTGNKTSTDSDPNAGIVAGEEITNPHLSRVSLGANGGNNVFADSYYITMSPSGSGATIPDLSNMPGLPDDNDPNDAIAKVRGATFWMGFEMNRLFSDDTIVRNGVGVGDQWVAEIVSFKITESVDNNPYGVVATFATQQTVAGILPGVFIPGDTVTDTITTTLAPIDTGNYIVPVHLSNRPQDFDASTNPPGSQDGEGLDFLEYTPVFGFHLLGGPDQELNTFPNIERIQIVISDENNRIDLMSANSPLRSINSSRYSGIQLRRNHDGGASVNALENEDRLVPIDPALTTYVNGTNGTDTLTLAFVPDRLPRDSVKNGFTNDGKLSVIDAGTASQILFNDEYFLGVLASSNARFGDTLEFTIPQDGLRFSGGVSSDLSSDVLGTSRIMFGPPILPSNLVTEGQILGEASAPTAMLRFQVFGANHDGLAIDRGELLSEVYTYFIDTSVTGAVNLSSSDFLDSNLNGAIDGIPFTNDQDTTRVSMSGVAVYRDLNGNGLYDQGVDTPIPFDPASINIANGTRFVDPGLDVDLLDGRSALLARMLLDTTNPYADVSYGETAVFFVVVRTGNTISPDDLFFAAMGDLDAVIDNGQYIDPVAAAIRLTTNYGQAQTWTNQAYLYEPTGDFLFGAVDLQFGSPANYSAQNLTIVNSVLAQSGLPAGFVYNQTGIPGWRREDHFLSEAIRGESIKDLQINPLTVAGQTIFPGDRVPIFGINVFSSTGIDVTIETMAVRVKGNSNFTVSDLASFSSLSSPGGNGIAVFTDSGGSTNGVFDASDPAPPLVSFEAPASGASEGTFILRFSPPLKVPQTDLDTDAGNDFYVVANISAVTFLDSFVVALPEKAFGFTLYTNKQPPGETSQVLTAGLPVTVTAQGDTVLNSDGTRLALLRIAATNIAAAGSVNLQEVTVNFEDVSGFSLADLASLTTDSRSGVSLYRDTGTLGGFYDSGDGFIDLNTITAVSTTEVRMILNAPGYAVPTTADSGWIVVFRGSINADVVTPDKFRVRIDTGDIVWSTQFAPTNTTARSGIISFTGDPIGLGDFSPGNSFNPFLPSGAGRDTISMRIKLGVSDSAVQVTIYEDSTTGAVLTTFATSADTTVTLNAATGAWSSRRYIARIVLTGTSVAEEKTFWVDTGTPKLVMPTPSKSASNPLLYVVTAQVSAITPLITGEGTSSEISQSEGPLAAENNEEFDIYVIVTAGDFSETKGHAAIAATSTAFSSSFNIVVFDTTVDQTITVVLVDAVGNSDSETFDVSATSAASVSGEVVMRDAAGNELKQPVFRLSPANPTIGFEFEKPLSGGDIEIYSPNGQRMAVLPAVPGSAIIRWDGKSAGGTTVRNGVYLFRTRVNFQGGGSLNQTRNLFLLK